MAYSSLPVKYRIIADRIMQNIYGGDIDGGPASRNILTVMKFKMQPALQKYGMKITCRRGPGALWRLEKI